MWRLWRGKTSYESGMQMLASALQDASCACSMALILIVELRGQGKSAGVWLHVAALRMKKVCHN